MLAEPPARTSPRPAAAQRVYNEPMITILGYSTDPESDGLVAERATALARERGADRVVMATQGGMTVTMGHGLGPELLPGESGHEAEGRAAAMCATARTAGLEAVAQAATGPDGACVEAICARYAPAAAVIGTAHRRLVGGLWDSEAVRAARKSCPEVEALHA